MWPMLVDYSVEDCKKELRSCELVAYSAIISAFRAQGSLTKEKRKILQDLSSILSISLERHRAEIRRALNDEHLNTIAEKLSGSNTATEWAIEGRRVVPLMQRHAPQTVFTEIANSVASAQAAKNASLLQSGKTGLKEVSNGPEFIASRKRKDYTPSDYASSVSPSKIPAIEGQYFSNLYYAENSNPVVSEPSPVPESYDNISVPEAVPPIPLPEFNAPKNTMSPTSSAPVSLSTKSMSKKPKKLFKSECESLQHPMLKTSTVTTFSSFDPMTSNVMASKVTSQNPSTMCQGDHVSTFSEHIKTTPDQKNPRPISSVGSIKSSTVVIPTSLSSACTTTPSSRGHLPTPSSSQHSKFMSPIRSKTPNYTRPNLPAGLGIKLGPQTQITQRATVPQKSMNMKMKSESPSFFSKKSTPTTFGSDNQTSPFQLPSSSDSLTITKSPISITKTAPKSEPQAILPPQTSTKSTASASKTIAKNTSAQNSSQFISRSLFSSANKGGPTKTLAPVIFNVASTSSPTLPTSTKTTGSIQSEVGKTSPQLLPKTSGVGVSPSHVKINTSATQTIQYRNDGGLVRSARILNISQPVGSRLPCAISPSAISALGLTTNISSTALRVTLPAGTLNTTSSIRVSAAAKPNVIVVHKAQMWPRNQQPGAAVIMGSSSLKKLPSDLKPDKSRPVMSKAPRAIAPARGQSQAISSSYKTSEAILNSGSNTIPCAASPITSIVPPSENSTSESQNSKVPDAMSDAQCKRNLLADVIEASGILSDKISPKKPSMKEKNDHGKMNKDLCNNQEAEAKCSQRNIVLSSTMDANSLNPEANVMKNEEAACETGDVTLHLVSQVDRNGVDESLPETQAQAAEAQTKESVEVTSAHVSSEYFKSSGCSKVQNDVVKEKDS